MALPISDMSELLRQAERIMREQRRAQAGNRRHVR